MDEDENRPLTPEEEDQLEALGYGYPRPQEKEGIFAFFNKVLRAKDSSKVANLSEEELMGVRRLQSLSSYCSVMQMLKVTDYIKNEAEIVLATSDSKIGFLINAAITQKKQYETKQKQGGKKRRWIFGKKEEQTQEENQ